MRLYGFTFVVPDLYDTIADQIYARCPDDRIGKSNGKKHVEFDREAAYLESDLNTETADFRQIGISPMRVEMAVSEIAMAS